MYKYIYCRDVSCDLFTVTLLQALPANDFICIDGQVNNSLHATEMFLMSPHVCMETIPFTYTHTHTHRLAGASRRWVILPKGTSAHIMLSHSAYISLTYTLSFSFSLSLSLSPDSVRGIGCPRQCVTCLTRWPSLHVPFLGWMVTSGIIAHLIIKQHSDALFLNWATVLLNVPCKKWWYETRTEEMCRWN